MAANLQQQSMITSEEIYRDLYHKIEYLEYMPGELLSENELARQYNTTRHTIRNAFAGLKQNRLIEVYPQRGSFVSLIDMDMVSDLMFLREAVERMALQELMDREDLIDETCDKMQAILEKQKKLGINGHPNKKFDELDRELHGTMLSSVGRLSAMELLQDEMVHFHRWRNLDLSVMLRNEDIIRQHEELIEAIRSRDKELADKRLLEHLDSKQYFDIVREKTDNQYFYKKQD